MGKTGGGFCLNRIRAHVRVRSPTIQCSHELTSSAKNDRKTEIPADAKEETTKDTDDQTTGVGPKGRRIMVVVDSSLEAKNALLWTLSHCVQDHETIVLLHVVRVKPSKPAANEESCNKPRTSRAYESVSPLKNICQLKRPEVFTEVVVVEGKEKGAAIVKEAREQGAALLVLGQKKQSTTWRLVLMWAGQGRPTSGNGVVEYCINHSPCMAIAVRKKSKKLGGYTITTKRHKDFWLLA